ncbi:MULTISPECIES: HAD family phosphatase [Streptomyces]|uniref:HAD family hydrolase n=1 Tax=Streptomyces venezuelae TaxID=54571 RepID=A0A5P2BC73_STRVZ|nr:MULTISPECIES: HAD family phosphatase [Streptomyces]NEA04276.1 HAD family phosphatase [Streptomyces sp. SID10116]MYY83345.1 HAD hydrolase-like protein [Streptomyces sp. SID335]MYZ13158.1 HAD hydrolase-like protein [Streptomyces sp. SID337]NDZ86023.1 HAD family phosphatase [Streptomyces sp. SID10115]NEB42990.1 HAD family phosphatase [Streptomyces sp. SID339]
MTSDSTQSDVTPTESATDETERLRNVVASIGYVLFDFDGPICRLFAGRPAADVARDLVRWLKERGLRGLLTAEEKEEPDPYVVLRAVDRRHPHSDLVAELEQWLTRQELNAVATAMPTAYVDPLIRTWSATGARLAVTTNNAPCAVGRYLERRGTLDCFAPHIYGRTQDLSLLKPHPDCVERALRAMGAKPRATLMIGDAPSDYVAAERAGVRFLGYARNERKARLLREAGAEHLVDSLERLSRVVYAMGHTKAP